MPPVHRKTDQGTGHGCFFRKTKISLLNGTEVEIKDLVGLKEFYVYSYDFKTNKIVPGRAHDCCITRRNQPLYKIILDNDEEIIATPDQEFMLRNAHYREVKDLKTGDSMMPLYRSTIKNAWSNKKVEMKINEYNPTAKEKCRQGGINCWNNRQKEGWDNPMHNKDTVKKMKNSLKKYWLDSDNRKKHSEKIKLSSKKLYEERPEIKEKISTSVRATFAKKHDFVSYQQYT
jgi:hypothetical protein